MSLLNYVDDLSVATKILSFMTTSFQSEVGTKMIVLLFIYNNTEISYKLHFV